jgi:hypothetical protein
VDSKNKNKHCSVIFGKIFASEIGTKIQKIVLNQGVINELIFWYEKC